MNERDNNKKKRSKHSGGNDGRGLPSSGGANDLLGLFAQPPLPSLKRTLHPSLFTPPASETDPLVPSSSTPYNIAQDIDVATLNSNARRINNKHIRNTVELGGGDTTTTDDDDGDDLSPTVRRINHQSNDNSGRDEIRIRTNEQQDKKGASLMTRESTPPFFDSISGGRELFLKTAAASAVQHHPQKQHQHQQLHGHNGNTAKSTGSNTVNIPVFGLGSVLGSLLAPFASPSTWIGGILFVLYHVVFCMANGGSITRPYSGGSSTSLLGDMARYTALGIIVSCPFLVFALSDSSDTAKHNRIRIGIPAMYPSADLFLAPFLAEAAAIIDMTIMDDFNSGVLAFNSSTHHDGEFSPSSDDENEELFLTRLWFGSFALVVSFGMFAAGSLLILASKIKLANLGTYLPYGVLCGFFSSVGILMWKLAITIDTPSNNNNNNNNTSQTDETYSDGIEAYQPPSHHDWTVILMHHLPSLMVGIAMNRLGPKHPFFVTGLIILTVVVFYGVMLIMGISLEEAESNGWFYSHDELQSSSSSFYTSIIPSEDEGMGIAATNVDDSWWWNSRMLPPCPFGIWFAFFGRYVHWRAVWKGAEQMVALAILYLLRSSIHAAALKKNIHNLIRREPVEGTAKIDAEATPINTTNDKNRDIEIDSFGGLPSPSSRKHRRNHSGASVASQLAQTVRTEVRIVNLSLADRQSLMGKCYTSSPRPPISPPRATSTGSITTAAVRNISGENSTERTFPKSPGLTSLVPTRNPLKLSKMNERKKEADDDYLLLPTTQRDVSVLTQRTAASYTPSEIRSIERKKSYGGATSIGGNPGGNHYTTKYSVDYVEIHAPSTDLTLEEIFVQYGYGLFVTGACGGFGCCPTIATSNTMYAIGAGKPTPQYFSVVLLLVAFYSSGFELVRFIPKAAFSSLLVLSAADNIVTWFIKPIYKMENLLEWSVVPFIAMFSLLVGFLNAVILGIGVSTFLFVTDFFRVGVVKYDASGLEIRSRIERSLVQSVWLDTHGDNIRVLVLQNYLFFGNASSVLGYIGTMFKEIPLAESIRLAYPIPPIPVVLVLDLSLITGMDTSAVDVFMDIWRVCKSNDCKLYLCGLSPRLKKTFSKGGLITDTKGARKARTLLYFSDLDHGLGRAEDVLIDKDMGDFASQSLFQLKKGSSGFHVALQLIDQLHSTNMADGLLELEPHTGIVTLDKGQILYEKDGGLIRENEHGLFFIESGMIREDDGRSDRTNTRTRGSFRHNSILTKVNENTLRGKHARLDTAAQMAALAKLAGNEATHKSNNLRIATAGPGWVVGANEFATGRHSLKKFKAITKVKMHHLLFSDLTRIEKENPALVLRLYKMLTHVMARKEEDTVAHLSTLHDILSSPAHSKPIPRLHIRPLSQK